jgi:hypothetical protein
MLRSRPQVGVSKHGPPPSFEMAASRPPQDEGGEDEAIE